MNERVSLTHAHPGLNLGQTDRGAHDKAPPVIFGFWLFLMSDLVLFALLFATFASMSAQGVAGGPGPADAVDLRSGAIETALLLTSTFTFGLTSLEMKHQPDARWTLVWLGVTALLGLGFLGMEGSDFVKLAARGAVPQRSGFLSSYWTLVGVHGLHVASAIAWLCVMVVQIFVFGLTGKVKRRLMRLALFWHMLDIVWVGIFSIVILMGALQ